jgi:hypothetical protein
MAVDEEGVDVGRTWGDLTSDVSAAIIQLANSNIRKVEGDGFTVYKVGSNLIRADVKVPAELP